jgi:hypothetical protein
MIGFFTVIERDEMQRISLKGRRVLFMGPYLTRRVAQPKQG